MERDDLAATLLRHQREAHALLREGAEATDTGVEQTLATLPALRARMATVLNAYQGFKHDGIFNPAMASSDPERLTLGRAMKAECIAAGEVFRSHLGRWKEADIKADWNNYTIAIHLAAGQLRRHINKERDGILRLIALQGNTSH